MTKKWADHTVEEKTAIYEGLAKVYDEHNHPAGLKPPGCASEYVNIMMANTEQNKVGPISVTGEFSISDSALVEEITPKIKECLAGVSDAVVKLSTKRGVGDPMGTIKTVNKLDGTECDVTHNPGEVLLLDFWATWCPPC